MLIEKTAAVCRNLSRADLRQPGRDAATFFLDFDSDEIDKILGPSAPGVHDVRNR